MPKISVIIPVYNKEKYLKKCLDSVCNQTLQDIEIICVNDFSKDKSLDILLSYAEQDDRISIINFTENKGVSSARNAAIKAANGEFVAFVDSDDFIDEDFYEKLYVKAIEDNSDVVKANIVTLDENNNVISKCSSIELYDFVEQNKAYFYCTFTTAIFKKSLILDNKLEFPENIKSFEDPYFLIKLITHANKVSILNNTNYYYVENLNSQTNKMISRQVIDDILKASLDILDYFDEISIDKEHYKIVFSYLFNELDSVSRSEKLPAELLEYSQCSLEKLKNNAKYLVECLEFKDQYKKQKIKKQMLASLRSNIKR